MSSTTPRSKPVENAPIAYGGASPRLPSLAGVSPRRGGFKAPTMLSTRRHTPSDREVLLRYHNDLTALAKMEEEKKQSASSSARGVLVTPTAPSGQGGRKAEGVQSARLLASTRNVGASEEDNNNLNTNNNIKDGATKPSDSVGGGRSQSLGKSIRFAFDSAQEQTAATVETAADPSLEDRRRAQAIPRPPSHSTAASSHPTPANPFPSPPSTTPYEEIQQRIAAFESRFQRGNLQRRMTTVFRSPGAITGSEAPSALPSLSPSPARGNGAPSNVAMTADALEKAFEELKFSFLDQIASEKKAAENEKEEIRKAQSQVSEKDRHDKQKRLEAALMADRLERLLLPRYKQSVKHHISASRDEHTRTVWMTDAMGALIGAAQQQSFVSFGDESGGVVESGSFDEESKKHKRSVNELINWLNTAAEQRIAHARARTRPSRTGPGWHLFRCFELCCDLCNFVLCKILPPEVFAGDPERFKRLVASAAQALAESMDLDDDFEKEEANLSSDATVACQKVDGIVASSPAIGIDTESSVAIQANDTGNGEAPKEGGFFLTRVPQPPAHSSASSLKETIEKKQLTRLRAERALTGIAKARLQELMPTHTYAQHVLDDDSLAVDAHQVAHPVVTKGKKHISSIKQTLQAAADRHGLWLSLTSPRLAHPPLHACAHIDGAHLRDSQKYRRQVVAITGAQPLLISDGTETSADAKSRATADTVARNAVTDIEDFHKPDDTVLPIVELLQDMAHMMVSNGAGEGGAASVTGDGLTTRGGIGGKRCRSAGRQAGIVEASLLHDIADSYCSFAKAISDPELRTVRPPKSDVVAIEGGGIIEKSPDGPASYVPTPKCAFAKRHMLLSTAPRIIIDATLSYLRTLIFPLSEESMRLERRHLKLLEYSITGEFRASELVDADVEAELNAITRRSYSHGGGRNGAASNEAALKELQLAASAAATSQQEKERMEMLGKEQNDQLRGEVLLRLRGELLFLFTGVDERQHMLEEHQRKERRRWEALDNRRKMRQQQQMGKHAAAMSSTHSPHATGAPSSFAMSQSSSSPTSPQRHQPPTAFNSPKGTSSPQRQGLSGEEVREKSPAPSHLSFGGGGSKSSRDVAVGGGGPQHHRRRSSVNNNNATHAYSHNIAVMMDDLKREDEEAVATMMLVSAQCGGVSVAGVTALAQQAQLRQHRQRLSVTESKKKRATLQNATELKAEGNGPHDPIEGGGVRIVIESSPTTVDVDEMEAPTNVFPLPPKAAVFDWQNAHSGGGGGAETALGANLGGGRATRPDVNPRATFLKPTASSALASAHVNATGHVSNHSAVAHSTKSPMRDTSTSALVGKKGRSASMIGGHSPNNPALSVSSHTQRNPLLVTRRDEDKEMQSITTEMLHLERHRRRHNPTINLKHPILEKQMTDAREVDAKVSDEFPNPAPIDDILMGDDSGEADDNDKPPPLPKLAYERGDFTNAETGRVRRFIEQSARAQMGAGGKGLGGTSGSHRLTNAKVMSSVHGPSVVAATPREEPETEGIGESDGEEDRRAKTTKKSKKPSTAEPVVGPDGVGPILGHYQYHAKDGHYYFPLETNATKVDPKTGEEARVVKLASVTETVVGVKEAAIVERFKQACKQTLPGNALMARWYEHRTGNGGAASRKYKDERKDRITIEAEKHLTNAAQPSGSTNTLQRGTFDVYGTSPLTILWTLSNDPRQGAGTRRGKSLSINWTF